MPFILYIIHATGSPDLSPSLPSQRDHPSRSKLPRFSASLVARSYFFTFACHITPFIKRSHTTQPPPPSSPTTTRAMYTTIPTARRSPAFVLSLFLLLLLNVASAFLQPPHHLLSKVAPLRQHQQHQRTPRALFMQKSEQEKEKHTHARTHTHTHNRKEALRNLGGGVGMMVLAAAAGGGTMVMTPASAAAASTRKSIKEIQFEMMKEGLDLTHAFKFAEAEQVYTELIALFGPSPGEHEKQVLAK